jgi:hypothetical protein
VPTYKPLNLYNNEYSWEIQKSTDISIDLGFLKDRILLTAVLNRSSTSNQLMLYQLPSQAGFSNIVKNSPGKVGNKNFELEINTVNVRKSNFKWNTSANLTVSRNKLLNFPQLASSEYRSIYIEGEPLNLEWGYRTAGVDPVTGYYRYYDKDGKLVDLANGGTLGDSDRVKIDTYDPSYYGGLQNSFQFNNWKLDILFQFVKQKGYNHLAAQVGNAGFPLLNVPVALRKRWREEGDNQPYQQYTQDISSTAYTAAYYYSTSDALVTDASYIRLKTISVSYSLPYKWIQKLKMKSCSLSIQGQNLLTITSYTGNDPESGTINRLGLPPLKTFAISIQASL